MVVGGVVFEYPYCNMWFIIILKLISTIDANHLMLPYYSGKWFRILKIIL